MSLKETWKSLVSVFRLPSDPAEPSSPSPEQVLDSRPDERLLVTATTHVLPFERLSPLDFERLSYWVLQREGYRRVQHLGASGSDGGRDLAAERDGRRVLIQCKRRKSFGPTDAEQAIAKLLNGRKQSTDEILLIVPCQVSSETRDRAALVAGKVPCIFWAQTELDETVKRHHEVLTEFFHVVFSGFEQVRPKSLGIVLAFLFIALSTASVTHQDFLLGGFVLPLVGVPVDVKEFFFLSPLLILIFHPYLLADHYSPRRKSFEPLEGNLYRLSQFLLGETFPLALLLWIQVRCLPYHSIELTVWHLILLIFDLLVVWYFRFRVRPTLEKLGQASAPRKWGRTLTRWSGLFLLGLLALAGVILAVAPYVERERGEVLIVPFSFDISARSLPLLRERPPAEIEVVYHQGYISEKELLDRYGGLDLRGRDLRHADFTGAQLPNADFRGADLTGAVFSGADLRGARFDPRLEDEHLSDPVGSAKRDFIFSSWREPENVTRLRDADFEEADLRGASFIRADMADAVLARADLRNAELLGANLYGANLHKAQLHGVELASADLTGANLAQAVLDGASLSNARLLGANLTGARLPAADLRRARLEGALLEGGLLDASDFREARTAGASFYRASLRGANGLELEAVDLRGSHIDGLDLCERSNPIVLTDLRGLVSTPRDPKESQDILQNLMQELEGEIRQEALERFDAASKRHTCLTKDPRSLEGRQSFYYDLDRVGAMAGWPERRLLSWGPGRVWKEKVFLEELCRVSAFYVTDVRGRPP